MKQGWRGELKKKERARKFCGKFGHNWDGCMCKRCGTVRDKEHDWNACECMRCGWVRREGHNWDDTCKCRHCGLREHLWDGCKCKRCGWKRNKEHVWDGLICKRCGWKKNESEETADIKYKNYRIGKKWDGRH